MRIFKPCLIFSVYQDLLPDVSNRLNHDDARDELQIAGAAFIEGTGSYSGKLERCFLVTSHFDRARTIASRYHQKTVLVLDANRAGRLETPGGELVETLGILENVPESVALAADSWSKFDGQYFVAKPASDSQKRAAERRAAFDSLIAVADRIDEFDRDSVDAQYFDTGDALDLLRDASVAIYGVQRYAG